VIVDEAHSSQTGETARELKAILGNSVGASAVEDAEGETDWEDRLNQVMASRGRQPNLSFFAFTATPKGKTLELFGRPVSGGVPEPFHLYSMRQAIEEEFILDVLTNYTTYATYYRLLKAAEVIGLGDSPGGIDLAGACRDTLKANNLEEARLRLTVTNGESEAFPWAGGGGKPSVVVTARPFTPFPPEKYEQGFRVSVASVRRCCQYQLSGIKSTGYLVSVLARREAAARGLDEALLLNERGHIAEGGTSNVFFVKAAALVTPSLEAGILPGITRELVLGLAASLGISVSQGEIGVPELAGFDEAFLTASHRTSEFYSSES